MRFTICVLLSVVALHATHAEEEGFVSLFDGKTLTGWDGKAEWFRVEDGAIVAGTMEKPIPNNEFLTNKKQYGDFELRLKVKVLGEGVNAGIQIRSQRIPNHHEMIGYQADIGQHYWGKLYDESRRRKVLAPAGNVDTRKLVKNGEWNDYVIRCKGPQIQLWLNGQKTVDYTEPDDKIERNGIIGLQIHSGPKSEAWYKELRIKEL